MYYLLIRATVAMLQWCRRALFALVPLLLMPTAMLRLQLALARNHARFWAQSDGSADEYLDMEEERMLRKHLGDVQSNRNERRVLDLFCGGGREARLLAGQGWQVHAVDAMESIINSNLRTRAPDGALKEIEYSQGKLPFALEKMQTMYAAIVICHGMYSTIPGRELRGNLLEELVRLTSDGGRILVSALLRPPGNPQSYFRRRRWARLLWGNRKLEQGDVFVGEFLHFFPDQEALLNELQHKRLRCVASGTQRLGGADQRCYVMLEKCAADESSDTRT
ncbi:MAG: class I SAM-dependent methyltransferase [Leptospiraceae bacterium]|nr:class I SAM-dependent methyltransferase [Leptospiraceae bacterium]